MVSTVGYLCTKNAANQHEVLEKNLYIHKDGFMETYVINETAEDVWFDNLRLTSTPSPVVQETHYDPWGLELTGIGYQQGGMKGNRYLYNGKEQLDDTGLQAYDYGARMYDPTIGRWGVVDPMAELYQLVSPFNYTLNNPLKFIDPNGMWVENAVGYSTDNPDEIRAFFGQDQENEEREIDRSTQPIVSESNCPDCGKMHKDATVMETGGVNVTIAPLGNFSIGLIRRQNDGEWRIILSVGPSAGLDGSVGVFGGTVSGPDNEQLEFSTLEGLGVSDSYSLGIFDYESGANSIRGRYGEFYRSSTVGISAGSPIGYSRNYSYTYTFDLKRFVLGK